MESKNKTIYETIFQNTNIFLDIFFVLLSVAGLALMANLRVPLWPVPITMQTFGVFLIAFFLGSRKGFLTIAAYILAGVAGIAVFSGWKSGASVLLGPTGGYLIGFLLMAFFIGLMIERGYGRTRKSVMLCMIVGEIILYACGLSGLYLYLGNASIGHLIMVGFVPFVIGDILKAGAAIALFPYLWKLPEKLGYRN